MKQRIMQASKMALSVGIVLAWCLAVLVIYYELANWANVSIGLMLSLLARVSGIITLIYLIMILTLNIPLDTENQKANPKAVAKAFFWVIIFGYVTFTASACMNGFMKVSFFKTIGAIILVAVVCAFVIWLLEIALEAKKRDQEKDTSNEGT